MDRTEKFLQNNHLQDPDDLDSLIELASLVRQLIDDSRSSDIGRVIRYTVEQGYFEAFSWCMGILQETFEREDCPFPTLECELGKSIPNYDELIERLQVDVQRPRNDLETVCDNFGEVTSFFNILVYHTGYRNLYLVSCENFDTKDNDYIQYKLLFTRH